MEIDLQRCFAYNKSMFGLLMALTFNPPHFSPGWLYYYNKRINRFEMVSTSLNAIITSRSAKRELSKRVGYVKCFNLLVSTPVR